MNAYFADSPDMTLDQLFALLKAVFLSPEVIGATVVIALYINIVSYIVRYRKKPPQEKKKAKKAAPVAERQTAAERAGHAAPEVEDEEDAVPAPRSKSTGKGKGK
jgi:hypothetical protein